MIHDALESWSTYLTAEPWARAFEFLRSLDRNSKIERHVSILGDDIYGAVMEYRTGGPSDSVLEAHNHYIDIQVSLKGAEGILCLPRDGLKVEVKYDIERDRTLFEYPGNPPVKVDNLPGFFTVLFPWDAHMPKQRVEGQGEMVKKAVVKLRKGLVL